MEFRNGLKNALEMARQSLSYYNIRILRSRNFGLSADVQSDKITDKVLALRWRDVDFKKGVIRVKRSYRRGRVTPTINGKICRVDMSAQLAETLKSNLPKTADELLLNHDGCFIE